MGNVIEVDKFDWERDYGPLYRACPSAFWLAPEPGERKRDVIDMRARQANYGDLLGNLARSYPNDPNQTSQLSMMQSYNLAGAANASQYQASQIGLLGALGLRGIL